MARKKPARKKKSVSKKKPSRNKTAKVAGIAKIARSKKKRVAAKKTKTKSAGKKKLAAKKKSAARRTTRGRQEITNPITPHGRRGLGAESGGQSGDTQGLSRRAYDDSESVEELQEEGQYAEAEAVSGVENAPDAYQGEVRTRQFPEDDVPEEYLDQD
jgi:hypothetical protein